MENFLIITALIITSVLELSVWAIILQNNNKKELGLFHWTHLIALWLWVIWMAFYYWLPQKENDILFWSKFLYFFWVFSWLSFLAFSCTVFFKKYIKKLSYFLIWISLLFFIFIFFTNFIISGIEFLPWNRRVLHWILYPLFFTFLTFSYLISFILLFIHSKKVKGIESYQIKLILLPLLSTFSVAFITNILLPAFWWNFHYAWIWPIFLLLPSITTYYAISNYRLLWICLQFPYILRKLLGFVLAIIITIVLYIFLKTSLKSEIILQLLSFVSLLIFYLSFSKVLKYFNFFYFSPQRSFDKFQFAINQFLSQKEFFKSLEELKEWLNNMLSKNLQPAFISIYSEDEIDKNLRKHFENNSKIIVQDELILKSKREWIKFWILNHIKNIWEVLIPLYRNWNERDFLGLFVLWKKPDESFYKKEEINLLEKLSMHISLLMISIFYSSHLQKEVNKKTKELQEIIKQQNDFILTASHELRTPITSIIAALEVLGEEVWNEELKKILKWTQDSAYKMKKLIKVLFEVQLLEQWKIKLEKSEVSLKEFLEEIFREHKTLIEEKWLKFKKELNISNNDMIKIDEIRFKQVLNNLLSNSLKFTKKWEITLLANKKWNSFILEVCDTWEWIPDKSKKYIFQKFRWNHAQKGYWIWLGLYICKKLVEMHWWKIWIEDNPKWGSCFFIKIKK